MELQLQEYQEQLTEVQQLLQVSPQDESLQTLQADLLELITITAQQIQQQQQHLPPAPLHHPDGGHNTPHEEKLPSSFLLEKALTEAVETSVGVVDNGYTAASRRHDEAVGVSVGSGHDPTVGATYGDDYQVVGYATSNMATTTTITGATAETTTVTGAEDGTFVDHAQDAIPSSSTKKRKTVMKDFEIPPHLIPLDTDTEAERNRKRRAIKSLKSKWKERKKDEESAMKQKSWQSFQKKKKLKETSIFSTGEDDTKVGVVSAGGRQLSTHEQRKRHKYDT